MLPQAAPPQVPNPPGSGAPGSAGWRVAPHRGRVSQRLKPPLGDSGR
jgi:hypothetical protein